MSDPRPSPPDPVTVLQELRRVRQFRVKLMEGVGEKADHMDVEQIAALDTALSALKLVQKMTDDSQIIRRDLGRGACPLPAGVEMTILRAVYRDGRGVKIGRGRGRPVKYVSPEGRFSVSRSTSGLWTIYDATIGNKNKVTGQVSRLNGARDLIREILAREGQPVPQEPR